MARQDLADFAPVVFIVFVEQIIAFVEVECDFSLRNRDLDFRDDFGHSQLV